MSAAAAEQPLFYLYGGLTGRCWRAPTRDKLTTFFNDLEDSISKGLFIRPLSKSEIFVLRMLYIFNINLLEPLLYCWKHKPRRVKKEHYEIEMITPDGSEIRKLKNTTYIYIWDKYGYEIPAYPLADFFAKKSDLMCELFIMLIQNTKGYADYYKYGTRDLRDIDMLHYPLIRWNLILSDSVPFDYIDICADWKNHKGNFYHLPQPHLAAIYKQPAPVASAPPLDNTSEPIIT